MLHGYNVASFDFEFHASTGIRIALVSWLVAVYVYRVIRDSCTTVRLVKYVSV